MQYANVIVDKRLAGLPTLTYSIPIDILPEICLGQLCEVPIGKKNYLGLIAGLTRKRPETNLRSIVKIISKGAVIYRSHLELYCKICYSSLSSINDVLFYFLPNKISKIEGELKFDAPIRALAKPVKVISGTTFNRFEKYFSLIEKYKKTCSLLFIFPDHSELDAFANLAKNNSIEFVLFHGRLNSKQRWENWIKIHSSKNVILATRIGLGLIPTNSIIIIDSPSHPGFQEDQRPRYAISELVKIRSLFGDQIILGDSFLQPTLKHFLGLRLLQYLPKIRLIEMHKLVLSEIFLEIEAHSRVLISAPKKGEWGILICRTCGEFMACRDCSHALGNIDADKYVCYFCHKQYSGIMPCKICKSTNFTGYGIGLKNIKKELENITDKKIIIIDKDNPMNLESLNQTGVIVLATTAILDLPVNKFDIVVIINYDGLLSIPLFNQEEKVFSNIVSLGNLGSEVKIYFQKINSQLFNFLSESKIDEYIRKIIADRFPNYPPYNRIVDLEISKKVDIEDIKKIASDVQIIDQDANHTKIRCFIGNQNWLKLYDFVLSNSSDIEVYPDPIK